jgi:hypothetical protein
MDDAHPDAGRRDAERKDTASPRLSFSASLLIASSHHRPRTNIPLKRLKTLRFRDPFEGAKSCPC